MRKEDLMLILTNCGQVRGACSNCKLRSTRDCTLTTMLAAKDLIQAQDSDIKRLNLEKQDMFLRIKKLRELHGHGLVKEALQLIRAANGLCGPEAKPIKFTALIKDVTYTDVPGLLSAVQSKLSACLKLYGGDANGKD